MDEFDGLEVIAEIYGDVFEEFDGSDRGLRAEEDFIRLVEDPGVNGYVKRVEAEKVLDDLDGLGRGRLDVVGKSVELFYGDVRDLVLMVCRGLRRWVDEV